MTCWDTSGAWNDAQCEQHVPSLEQTCVCGPGSYCQPGAPSCQPCPAGAWGGVAGQLSEEDACPHQCRAGTWGTTPGSSSEAEACPNACPSGSWGNATGQSTQDAACPYACPAGTWGGEGGTCSPCRPGSFCPVCSQEECVSDCDGGAVVRAGFPVCMSCPLGKFGNVTGAQTVEDACPDSCPGGTWGNRTGAASEKEACAPCPAGSASRAEGASNSSTCVPCLIGQSSPPAALDCEACLPGWTTHAPGSSPCVECEAGTFGLVSAENRTAWCQPCPAGTYSTAPVPLKCTACPAGAPPHARIGRLADHCIGTLTPRAQARGATAQESGSSRASLAQSSVHGARGATSPARSPLSRRASRARQGRQAPSRVRHRPTRAPIVRLGSTAARAAQPTAPCAPPEHMARMVPPTRLPSAKSALRGRIAAKPGPPQLRRARVACRGRLRPPLDLLRASRASSARTHHGMGRNSALGARIHSSRRAEQAPAGAAPTALDQPP